MEKHSAQTNTGKQRPVQEVAHTKSPQRVRVKAVRFVGYEDVYNMEVDRQHNFAVNNGVIVHNCIDALRYALRPYLNDYDGSLGVNWNEQYEIGERMGVNY